MADYYSGNFYLTHDQMTTNALYITAIFRSSGWSFNAIAAMLGNMQAESTINPGIWENLEEGNLDRGYGLVQWTPATKFLDWCDHKGLDPTTPQSAVDRINYELENKLQWYATPSYNMTFLQFKTSTIDPFTLAMAFLRNYERPANIDQPNRGYNAQHWYNIITGGLLPDLPIPPRPWELGGSLPLWFYLKNF